jgi:hypothetical protein
MCQYWKPIKWGGSGCFENPLIGECQLDKPQESINGYVFPKKESTDTCDFYKIKKEGA